jgi:hypothetical protein
MLIRLGFDIQFDLPLDVPFIGLVNVHPSRTKDLREPDELTVEPRLPVTSVRRYLREPLHPISRAEGPAAPL